MNGIRDEFFESLEQGFVDASIQSTGKYAPKFLTNDDDSHRNVLSELKAQLDRCERFDFSVAFITSSGIAAIIQLLIELRERKIPGRILTTTYNNFNEPEALRKLLEFPNIEVRVFEGNMHTKGYFFKQGLTNAVVIGSANLTQAALCLNKEWNILLHSFDDGEIFQKVRREYEVLWGSPHAVTMTAEWIDAYENYRNAAQPENSISRPSPFTSQGMTFYPEEIVHEDDTTYEIRSISPQIENRSLGLAQSGNTSSQPSHQAVISVTPNAMQRDALRSLAKIHAEQAERALLISATGTGKTYLSAFDIAATKAHKVLFVAHRKRILEASLKSFKCVLGDAYRYGMYAGNERDLEATCLFSMVSTLARHLDDFNPLEFDYIVIDETHRAGAESYRKVLSHFAPKFVLGMTATPQRSDHYDIFKLFNHVIAYRITLLDALREDMLVPFHYYGISDLNIDDNAKDDLGLFNRLTEKARVDHVVHAIEDYSVEKNHRKGLIFCSRNDEARALSGEFNARGYRTRAISGETTEADRNQAIADLEAEQLQYLFSVDILNEGVDIPSLNQIIMLRPTQSAIVFVQQLGRGLRKCDGKESVLVLDFIGNYQNNYLIPIALSGDCTYDKDNLRRFVKEGSAIIPGCSTVSFDRIAEERIFEKLDTARFSSVELVKGEYKNLKAILGGIPKLMDFDEQKTIDPLLIFQCGGVSSYHDFLTKYESEYDVEFTALQERMLRYISKKLSDGKRALDLLVLEELIVRGVVTAERFATFCGVQESDVAKARESVIACLTNNFVVSTQRTAAFAGCVFLDEDEVGDGGAREGDFRISLEFAQSLDDAEFKRQMLEVVRFGLHRNRRDYAAPLSGTDLVLYQKYSYEDAFRLLRWPSDVNKQNVGGYMYNADTNTFPVFINYQKEDDISETTKYEDRFLSDREIVAISKSKRKLTSPEIVRLKECDNNGMRIYLFVRKNKNDSDGGKEFYFLGEMHPTQHYEQFTMPNSNATAVRIGYELATPVRPDIYDYLTSVIA